MLEKGIVLKLSCKDVIGIVASVSSFLASQQCNILESNQYQEIETSQFFMRVHFTTDSVQLATLQQEFFAIAQLYIMDWTMVDATKPLTTLILVSKFDHCLNDLLYRSRYQNFNLDIVAITSNHKNAQTLSEKYNYPFYYLKCSSTDKEKMKQEQEKKIMDLVAKHKVQLVILARYMQILSPSLCEALYGKAINIHHSFLPSFKGAKPYHQAFQRGVKVIGATAHYVTTDLDEGPIIEQAVTPINHNYSISDLIEVGRDIESQVLARAVKYHSEHRILINGHKTIVFS